MISYSPAETRRIAATLAKKLAAGSVVALCGELGSGKTHFVQGLAEGLGIPREAYVRSPTFTIIAEYQGGRLLLVHLDFYRLRDLPDVTGLGLDEYFEAGGMVAIEWADRFPELLPPGTIRVSFEVLDETTREIILVQ